MPHPNAPVGSAHLLFWPATKTGFHHPIPCHSCAPAKTRRPHEHFKTTKIDHHARLARTFMCGGPVQTLVLVNWPRKLRQTLRHHATCSSPTHVHRGYWSPVALRHTVCGLWGGQLHKNWRKCWRFASCWRNTRDTDIELGQRTDQCNARN